MSKYELTHNGAKVGVYDDKIEALEEIDRILEEIGGKYVAKVNHTTCDCDTEAEISTLIYQVDEAGQQTFLIEKIDVAED